MCFINKDNLNQSLLKFANFIDHLHIWKYIVINSVQQGNRQLYGPTDFVW